MHYTDISICSYTITRSKELLSCIYQSVLGYHCEPHEVNNIDHLIKKEVTAPDIPSVTMAVVLFRYNGPVPGV